MGHVRLDASNLGMREDRFLQVLDESLAGLRADVLREYRERLEAAGRYAFRQSALFSGESGTTAAGVR